MITERFDASDALDVFFDVAKLIDAALFDGALGSVRAALEPRIPDNYFPDIYIELGPARGQLTGAYVAFDSFDRHRIEYEGLDTAGLLSALPMPRRIDDVTGFDMEGKPFVFTQRPVPAKEFDWESTDIADKMRGLPGSVFTCEKDGETLIIFAPEEMRDPAKFIADTTFKTKMEALIAKGVLPENTREALKIRGLYRIPYLYNGKFGTGILKITIGYFAFILKGGAVTGCRAAIKVTTKSASDFGRALKPYYITQWHITDMCDQRCKHCYLFGQDPAIVCFSTPYDKLLLTLEKLEKNAAMHGGTPLPVLTGGDPILHPRFWEFAEELHRRGYPFEMLGNPFHLTDEVCARLYDLGCLRYQLSLDGLEEFHDKLRKKGSYRATLDAVPILKKSGIKATFMATASRENLDDILAAMDVAVDVGAELFGFARYCATASEKAQALYPTPEEYHEFLLKYYKKRAAYMAKGCKTRFALKDHLFTLLEWELGKFKPQKHEGAPKICDGCHLGQTLCILPNGDMMACRRMESIVGNVWTDDYFETLYGSACGAYAAIANIEKCRDCELLEYCRGCRAVGYNATGNLQGEDPMCWYKP